MLHFCTSLSSKQKRFHFINNSLIQMILKKDRFNWREGRGVVIKNVNSIIDFILGKETELNGHFYQLLRVDYFVKRTLKSKPRGMQNVSHIQRKGKMRGLWKIGDFSLENSWILWSCSTNFCVSTPFSCNLFCVFTYLSCIYAEKTWVWVLGKIGYWFWIQWTFEWNGIEENLRWYCLVSPSPFTFLHFWRARVFIKFTVFQTFLNFRIIFSNLNYFEIFSWIKFCSLVYLSGLRGLRPQNARGLRRVCVCDVVVKNFSDFPRVPLWFSS